MNSLEIKNITLKNNDDVKKKKKKNKENDNMYIEIKTKPIVNITVGKFPISF